MQSTCSFVGCTTDNADPLPRGSCRSSAVMSCSHRSRSLSNVSVTSQPAPCMVSLSSSSTSSSLSLCVHDSESARHGRASKRRETSDGQLFRSSASVWVEKHDADSSHRTHTGSEGGENSRNSKNVMCASATSSYRCSINHFRDDGCGYGSKEEKEDNSPSHTHSIHITKCSPQAALAPQSRQRSMSLNLSRQNSFLSRGEEGDDIAPVPQTSSSKENMGMHVAASENDRSETDAIKDVSINTHCSRDTCAAAAVTPALADSHNLLVLDDYVSHAVCTDAHSLPSSCFRAIPVHDEGEGEIGMHKMDLPAHQCVRATDVWSPVKSHQTNSTMCPAEEQRDQQDRDWAYTDFAHTKSWVQCDNGCLLPSSEKEEELLLQGLADAPSSSRAEEIEEELAFRAVANELVKLQNEFACSSLLPHRCHRVQTDVLPHDKSNVDEFSSNNTYVNTDSINHDSHSNIDKKYEDDVWDSAAKCSEDVSHVVTPCLVDPSAIAFADILKDAQGTSSVKSHDASIITSQDNDAGHTAQEWALLRHRAQRAEQRCRLFTRALEQLYVEKQELERQCAALQSAPAQAQAQAQEERSVLGHGNVVPDAWSMDVGVAVAAAENVSNEYSHIRHSEAVVVCSEADAECDHAETWQQQQEDTTRTRDLLPCAVKDTGGRREAHDVVRCSRIEQQEDKVSRACHQDEDVNVVVVVAAATAGVKDKEVYGDDASILSELEDVPSSHGCCDDKHEEGEEHGIEHEDEHVSVEGDEQRTEKELMRNRRAGWHLVRVITDHANISAPAASTTVAAESQESTPCSCVHCAHLLSQLRRACEAARQEQSYLAASQEDWHSSLYDLAHRLQHLIGRVRQVQLRLARMQDTKSNSNSGCSRSSGVSSSHVNDDARSRGAAYATRQQSNADSAPPHSSAATSMFFSVAAAAAESAAVGPLLWSSATGNFVEPHHRQPSGSLSVSYKSSRNSNLSCKTRGSNLDPGEQEDDVVAIAMTTDADRHVASGDSNSTDAHYSSSTSRIIANSHTNRMTLTNVGTHSSSSNNSRNANGKVSPTHLAEDGCCRAVYPFAHSPVEETPATTVPSSPLRHGRSSDKETSQTKGGMDQHRRRQLYIQLLAGELAQCMRAVRALCRRAQHASTESQLRLHRVRPTCCCAKSFIRSTCDMNRADVCVVHTADDVVRSTQPCVLARSDRCDCARCDSSSECTCSPASVCSVLHPCRTSTCDEPGTKPSLPVTQLSLSYSSPPWNSVLPPFFAFLRSRLPWLSALERQVQQSKQSMHMFCRDATTSSTAPKDASISAHTNNSTDTSGYFTNTHGTASTTKSTQKAQSTLQPNQVDAEEEVCAQWRCWNELHREVSAEHAQRVRQARVMRRSIEHYCGSAKDNVRVVANIKGIHGNGANSSVYEGKDGCNARQDGTKDSKDIGHAGIEDDACVSVILTEEMNRLTPEAKAILKQVYEAAESKLHHSTAWMSVCLSGLVSVALVTLEYNKYRA